MRRISSRLTWWNKKAFPAVWFGLLGIWTLGYTTGIILQGVPAYPLLAALALGASGYVLMKWLVFPLLDEVLIEDDEIVVRNRGEEDRFPITNIINVEGSLLVSPERIVLTLMDPCKFGREIVFSPRFRWWHLSRHPIADELIRRARGIDDPAFRG